MRFIKDINELVIGDYIMFTNSEGTHPRWVSFSRVIDGVITFSKHMDGVKVKMYYSQSRDCSRFTTNIHSIENKGFAINTDLIYLLNDDEVTSQILMETI